MDAKLAGAHFPLDGISRYLSCFGYVDGRLYIGSRHHMGIMQFLLSHGYDFQSLMDASQAWGWIDNDPIYTAQYYPDSPTAKKLQIRLSTDAAAIDPALAPNVCAAFQKALGFPTEVNQISKPTNSDYAPNYKQKYEDGAGYYKNTDPIDGCYIYDTHDGWKGWVDSTDLSHQFPPPKEDSPVNPDQQQLFDHPVPGGGAPPPKKQIPASEYVVGYHPPIQSSWQEVDDLWYDDGDVEEDFLAPPQIERLSSLPAVTRLPWLLGMDGQVRFGQPEEHHVDLGYDGDEPASGDVYVGMDGAYNNPLTPGQNYLRVLDLEPDTDFEWVVQVVRKKWDELYPDEPITSVKNATPQANSFYNSGLTHGASYDILYPMSKFANYLTDAEITNGWEVRQMESGEYTHHHAVVIDRKNKRLYINYNGHHGPLIEAATSEGVSYHDFMDTVMGHYRLEPSKTENFAEGWGFHGGSGNPEEFDALGHHIKLYHKVSNLEEAWVTNKVTTIKWLNVCPNVWNMSVKWKALWDKNENELSIWKTCGDEAHHADSLADFFPGKVFKTGNIKKNSGFVQAEGTYITPSYIIAPGSNTPTEDVNKVRTLLKAALEEKFPTSAMEYVPSASKEPEFVI